MPYSSPSTQATGQVGTAAYANSLKAATDYLANPPACRVYRSTNQSIPNVTITALTFDSERFDTNTMHSTVTNTGRITIVTAGIYVITAGVWFAANASGMREGWMQVNGGTRIAESIQVAAGGGNGTRLSIATIYKLSVNDYVEVIAYQDSGGALNVEAFGAASPEFSAVWVGLG